MPIFDGPNLLITLDPLPSPNDGAQSLNVQDDLYEEWKLWANTNPENLKYPPAFRTIGGDPLTPGVEAGAYFFLRNDYGWRIISSDENQTINYAGNLVGEDSAEELVIPTPTRTVLHLGLQPVTQRVDEILGIVQDSLYGGKVYIDTTGLGESGTVFPAGTSSNPVDNLADALTIAAREGTRDFYVSGPLALDSAGSYPSSPTWFGVSTNASLDINGTDIEGMRFQRLFLSGAVGAPPSPDGNNVVVEDCSIVSPLTNFAGEIKNSSLGDTSIQLRSGDSKFMGCSSVAEGLASPTIDGNGQSGIRFIMRNFNGGAGIANFTAGDTVATFGFNVGRFNIDATCTDFGFAEVRGTVEINNESSLLDGPITSVSPPVQFNTDGAVDPKDIAFIKAMAAGRVEFSAAASPDDGTILITGYDDNGNVIRRLILDETIAGAETRVVV